ncbi:MAG: radical SAM family heme chaperone HemW [Cyclobacteriaceae bacterium]|nr:radical SAM family heme chaperone HemW [Cyclobacteriaceae bacterium]
MAGLYFHIPFCKQACYYCDFHFSTNQQIKSTLVEALVRELTLQQNFLADETIHTIYFGGGTPSILTKEEIEMLLSAAKEYYPVHPDAEITLEANPDDLDEGKLADLKRAGINRLSIGIQTFHNDLLRFMNRAHNAATALNAFQNARKVDFNNISIDLIYAIPGETEEQWLEDIRQVIELQPEHVSCYSLTVEEKTVFGKWSTAGKLNVVEDDLAAQQLELLMDELDRAGYEHYEISNFAKPGYYSRHNSSYWRQQNYLGIGPSAHSYNGAIRQFNISNNHLYVKAIEQNNVPAQTEVLTTENKINEYILTTLRTHWGTNLDYLKQHHNIDLLKENSVYLDQLFEKGLVVLNQNVLTLTRKGKLMADRIASDLFVVEK